MSALGRKTTASSQQRSLTMSVFKTRQFAVVLEADLRPPTTVVLDADTTVFGRSQYPATDVQLADVSVARMHFEIRWNPLLATHEVADYGAVFSPTVNNDVLRGECRALSPGDIIALGTTRSVTSTSSIPTQATTPSSDGRDEDRNFAARKFRSIIRRFFAALDVRDFELLCLMMSPGLQVIAGGRTFRREDTVSILKSVFDAFAGWRCVVDDIRAVGRNHFATVSMSGTAADIATATSVTGFGPPGRRLDLLNQEFDFRVDHGCVLNINWTSFEIARYLIQVHRRDSCPWDRLLR
jgi:pSer/pThr/pTyr-binding forkhead associated (FHA) protein